MSREQDVECTARSDDTGGGVTQLTTLGFGLLKQHLQQHFFLLCPRPRPAALHVVKNFALQSIIYNRHTLQGSTCEWQNDKLLRIPLSQSLQRRQQSKMYMYALTTPLV